MDRSALWSTPGRRAAVAAIGALVATQLVMLEASSPADAAEVQPTVTVPEAGVFEVGTTPRRLTQPTDLGLGRLTPSADAAERGMFSPVQDWPIIPIHAAVGIDGSLTTFGAPVGQAVQDGRTFVTWNPATGEQKILPSMMDYNSFCSGTSTLADGRIVMVGGNNGSEMMTHVYDPRTGQQSMGPKTSEQRWYGSLVRRPDGRMLILGGGTSYQNGEGWRDPDNQPTVGDTPEIGSGMGTSSASWRRLEGATSNLLFGAVNNAWWYPRAYNAPDGTVFGVSWDEMWSLDDSGNGSVRQWGRLSAPIGASGSSVMYAPGKLMFSGGGQRVNGDGIRANNVTSLVDITGATPRVTVGAPMQRARNWHNLTVLPAGQVYANGGTSLGDYGEAANAGEIWDPTTGRWSTAATSAKLRTYHSSAALLPSGAVFTGGTGAPGVQNNLDAEMFYPPNLFAKGADGGVKWADRPAIATLGGDLRLGGTVTAQIGDTRTISSASLISLSSTTHSYNSDQRRIPLQVQQSGSQLQLTIPGNRNVVPAGSYLLSIVDANGVPSRSQTVTLRDGQAGQVTVYDTGIVVDPAAPAGLGTTSLGSFEEGTPPAEGGYADVPAGSTFGPWRVTSGLSRDGRAFHPGPGASGSVVDLDSNGSLERTLTGLSPGATYRLEVATARNLATRGAVSARVDVDQVSRSWVPANQSNTDFNTVTVTFTASAASVTLKFTGTGSPLASSGAIIDNPRLVLVKNAPTATPSPTSTPTVTPTATPTATPTSPVSVVGAGSGRCLDVWGSDPANGARTSIYDCHGSANQKWTVTSAGQLRNQATGKCLDVSGAGRADGTTVFQWECSTAANQRWTLDSRQRLVSADSGKCLDVDRGLTANGSKLQIWTCHDGTNQRWSFR